MIKKYGLALILLSCVAHTSIADTTQAAPTSNDLEDFVSYDQCFVTRISKMCKVSFDKCMTSAISAGEMKDCGTKDDNCWDKEDDFCNDLKLP